MFSTFPDGWPGAGLLLLRAAAGAGLFAQGIAYFWDKHDLAPLILAVALFTVSIGTLLLIGCLTRFTALAAALAGVAGMLSWFPGPNVGLFENRMTAALGVVIVAAVICLGPGAFSVDARLFGRREVIIPKNPSAPDI